MSHPTTIQAIGLEKQGDFDVIQKLELPLPKQEPNHVLIKVEAAGINMVDTAFRSGLYPVKTFPAVLGAEAAGTIVALPTDEGILASEDYKKRGFKVGSRVGAVGMGAMGAYISFPWNNVFALPDSVSTLQGAASLVQGLTALTFITEAYDVKKGDTILVHAVAGGLGLQLTQAIKSRGATVIGTTSTPEKAELAKQYGADHVILYKSEDTVKRVLEITGGKGVEAVYDGIGKDTFEANFEMLKRKGSLVSVGNNSGPVPPFAPLKLVVKNIKLVRPSMFNYIVEPEEAYFYSTQLLDLLATGKIKVSVHKEYEFTGEAVQQAQKDLLSGKTTGKLLVKLP